MNHGPRRACGAALDRLSHLRARPLSDADLDRPTLVVAPHFDDETLGCGGTIARKRQLGAPVLVAFLTDGSRSHAAMEPGELAARRRAEGLAATTALGVGPDDVTFLGFAEERLQEAHQEAVGALADLLRAMPVEHVLVPCRWETADHAAANAIAVEAVARADRAATMLEYPVWFWHRWPWVPRAVDGARRAAWRRAATGVWRLLASFDTRVDVSGVLATKRAALAEHRSQTTRLRDDVDWPVLGDVGGGEWLSRFFTGTELFLRRPPSRTR